MSQSATSINKSLGERVSNSSAGRKLRNTRLRMTKALREYEQTAGNVSATCTRAGITRRTFYRWSDPRSSNRIHRWFQKRLDRINPIDVLLDAAELTIAQKIAQGDLKASMFVINKLGHTRGWTEKPPASASLSEQVSQAEKAVKAYNLWLADFPNATETVKAEWLTRFAKVSGVSEADIMRAIRLQEFTSR